MAETMKGRIRAAIEDAAIKYGQDMHANACHIKSKMSPGSWSVYIWAAELGDTLWQPYECRRSDNWGLLFFQGPFKWLYYIVYSHWSMLEKSYINLLDERDTDSTVPAVCSSLLQEHDRQHQRGLVHQHHSNSRETVQWHLCDGKILEKHAELGERNQLECDHQGGSSGRLILLRLQFHGPFFELGKYR